MGVLQKNFFAVLLLLLALKSPAQQTNPDYELGLSCYHRSDWDGAITNFTKAIESAFDLHNSYSYRAYARAMKGDSAGAMADCNCALQLEPNFSGAYYWRSRVELELTNYDAALRDFEVGIKLDPKARPADLAERLSSKCCSQAFKKYKAEDLESAITKSDEAIYIAPTNAWAYSLRGFCKLLQNHFDGAIADEFLAIKFYPKNPEPYQTRAWARYERGDISGATEDCKKALELWTNIFAEGRDKSDWAEYEMSNGLLFFINGDFGKAAEKWDVSLKTNPEPLPAPMNKFIQSWIEKAKAKLHEAQTTAGTNSSPSADARQ